MTDEQFVIWGTSFYFQVRVGLGWQVADEAKIFCCPKMTLGKFPCNYGIKPSDDGESVYTKNLQQRAKG
ncbi:MAG: hypothetical protein N3B10_04270 [Armatimonadetes bacterium]|nr:hypothetical protein [Armatimonadota bacterium]MCX7967692.1 hypothetical protein [Armatimonadota bacterium]MDW8142686.1 hypothetical protein [Armatimonadota bacterium]